MKKKLKILVSVKNDIGRLLVQMSLYYHTILLWIALPIFTSVVCILTLLIKEI